MRSLLILATIVAGTNADMSCNDNREEWNNGCDCSVADDKMSTESFAQMQSFFTACGCAERYRPRSSWMCPKGAREQVRIGTRCMRST